jgi:hypothetical protein
MSWILQRWNLHSPSSSYLATSLHCTGYDLCLHCQKKPIKSPRGQLSVLHPLVQIGCDLEGLCTDVLTVQFSKEVNETRLRRKNFYKAKWVIKARCNYCKVLYKCRYPKVEVSKAIVNYRNTQEKICVKFNWKVVTQKTNIIKAEGNIGDYYYEHYYYNYYCCRNFTIILPITWCTHQPKKIPTEIYDHM